MEGWLTENWFDLISTVGIVGSLWVAIISIRSETKSRRVSNLLAITANHREVWKEFARSPEWARVIDPAADVEKQPVTPAEELFVVLVISHVHSVFYATKDELVIKWESYRRDIAKFLSLPIPNAVWTKSKLLQNLDFAAFIESTLKDL